MASKTTIVAISVACLATAAAAYYVKTNKTKKTESS
eukprot:CAMPEP_0194243454 /NCGR_PEP_ID=MMETSP0158-20130606/9139_1 /TAXON_ID=33649 /ORGANISM="Thalassionema nitzschioides, Strain L26-B" /LENGTH=35 /DNA_ID= /DNA_START= /DNA_END= /DNA_ORIENTATION=